MEKETKKWMDFTGGVEEVEVGSDREKELQKALNACGLYELKEGETSTPIDWGELKDNLYNDVKGKLKIQDEK